MVPKQLIHGCTELLADLKLRLNAHYNITDPFRDSWNQWFKRNQPQNDDVAMYIKSHRYYCPMLSYFKPQTQYKPNWAPTIPKCSFSIFPSTIVIALPSVRSTFDRHSTATPYLQIIDANNEDVEASVRAAYQHYKELEISRIKKLQGKRVKHIVGRKVKHNGATYPSSGTVEKQATLIFDCDINVTVDWLTPPIDFHEFRLVDQMFDGGEELNLNANNEVVSINAISVKLRNIMSLKFHNQVDEILMDALMELHRMRDKQICEAHATVNNRKPGYRARQMSFYFSSLLSSTMFREDVPTENTLSKHVILSLITEQRILVNYYRIIIPYFHAPSLEWMLAILDISTRTVHFIYPKYSTNILSASDHDARIALNLVLRTILLMFIEQFGNINDQQPGPALPLPQQAWQFKYHNPQDDTIAVYSRSPSGMPGSIESKIDSGIYISHAMECDYFDVPVFFCPEHLNTIRRKIAYGILNQQLPI